MRALLVVTLALLAAPATAQAGAVALEGTELVFRARPNAENTFEAREAAGVLTFRGREGGALRMTAGAGCTRGRGRVDCPLAGVTAVRLRTGDQDDLVVALVDSVPLHVDLGSGHDDFDGRAPTLAVVGGDGDDRVGYEGLGGSVDLGAGEDSAEVTLGAAFAGPLTVAAGSGRDIIALYGPRKAGVSLDAGAGDDEVSVQLADGGAGVDLACGSGRDRVQLSLVDRPGAGCAPHVAVPAPGAVSRAFSGAALSAPARGTVALHRATGRSVLLARGAFSAPAGPLALRLKTTKAGRAAIRRDPDLRVYVTVTTRRGGDHSEVQWRSRLEPG